MFLNFFEIIQNSTQHKSQLNVINLIFMTHPLRSKIVHNKIILDFFGAKAPPKENHLKFFMKPK